MKMFYCNKLATSSSYQ